MLYVSTRSAVDACTVHKMLQTGRASDGGLYAPFRLPKLSEEEIRCFAGMEFGSAVAKILNLLFNTRLTGQDILLCAGRMPVRLQQVNQRLVMAQCWHNPRWAFSGLEGELRKLLGQVPEAAMTGCWEAVGIRMAVLFGIYGALMAEGIAAPDKTVDAVFAVGDFSGPMAAWYARNMGLPIGNILCACNENGNLWDFICHGQLRTDGIAVKTVVPEGDNVVPLGLERLIHAFGGAAEANRYADTLHRGGTYYAEDRFLKPMRRGIYVTVSSSTRILETIPLFYANHAQLLSGETALAYAGLQDYRARTGESRCAVLFSEKSAAADRQTAARAMGLSPAEISRYF